MKALIKYIAKDGDRLDKIIFEKYQALDLLQEVINLNCHLNAVLKAGDTVYLPESYRKQPKGKKLW